MSQDESTWRKRSTLVDGDTREQLGDAGVPGLTVLWHPDLDRVGEEAGLPGLLSDGSESLSRSEPYFVPPAGGTPRPLAVPHLSRQPVRLTRLPDGGLRLDPGATRASVAVAGVPATGPRDVRREELEDGVVLLLGQRVVLFLHLFPSSRPRPPGFGLVGESAAVLRLRQEIESLADLDYPVLLRGESGTGKELVARALHEAGRLRRTGPFVPVNMGAVPAALAAAELFGADRGAYSGADRKRRGYFQHARGGTLFLDEIGEASADVQVLLLRALESGQVHPVGDPRGVDVDVRLISATDADLEEAIAAGEFREPLYHRLSDCELQLPPLRDRRDDVGRLFSYFLRKELEAVGESGRLDPPRAADDDAWVPADFVGRLAAAPWPGNVRQLRNVVRQVVVANRGETDWRVPDRIESLLRETPEPATADGASPEPVPPAYRQPEEVSEAELIEALRENRWYVRKSATALNVSPPSFYSLMRKYRIRTASDLSREEIVDATRRCGGRIADMVDELEVSQRGLLLRMNGLGLDLKETP